MLQKVENRQYQDLVFKAQYMRDQQEKKFEQEMQVSNWRKEATPSHSLFVVLSLTFAHDGLGTQQ